VASSIAVMSDARADGVALPRRTWPLTSNQRMSMHRRATF
jgi:hypothetical protein